MGSGANGSYFSNSSQPYAPSYHVVQSEFAKDKEDADIYHPTKGYYKNPLATSITSAIKDDKVYMNGKPAHGTMTYAMDKDGNMIFAKRFNPNDSSKRSPHPTLIGGKDPQVQCAGMIEFSKGKIVGFDNGSGHFRPNEKSLDKVTKYFDDLKIKKPKVFSSRYKGGKKYE
ncbi:MAG: hypothetical protein MJ143_02620 [Clostridia bacterium]|nr:hypothetical protein [Clostridia bacterium]